MAEPISDKELLALFDGALDSRPEREGLEQSEIAALRIVYDRGRSDAQAETMSAVITPPASVARLRSIQLDPNGMGRIEVGPVPEPPPGLLSDDEPAPDALSEGDPRNEAKWRCPHFVQGSITLRRRCTACIADAIQNRAEVVEAVIRGMPMHVRDEGLTIHVDDLTTGLRRAYDMGRATTGVTPPIPVVRTNPR